MTTVEVPEELTKYLDDIIETEDQFKEDFREFVFDYHPDQGGDGDIDFDKMTNLRDDIIDELEDGNQVEINEKADPEARIEDSLQLGLDVYTDSVEDVNEYDVIDMHVTPEEIYATVEKKFTDLKAGLEIYPNGEEVKAEATYFGGKIGEPDEVDFAVSYESILEAAEDDLSTREMIERGLAGTGYRVARTAEEELIPEYE
ncbi:hypothetical protein GLU64_02280 [Nanohaloarchaea archaeon]|nr:hypothetical protein [Candidatus Nanohaloarchaea archaeon]